MKQNAKNRYNMRYNNNNRASRTFPQNISRHTSLESSGPSGKLHGTALQLFEKYTQAAKDALIQNDRVLSETCLQYADHYARLQNMIIENEQTNRPIKRPTPAESAPESSENAPQSSEQPDSLPDFEAPTPVDDGLTEADKAVQAMDLSIPIQVMQKNNVQPPHRRGRPPRTRQSEQSIQPMPVEPETPTDA